MAQIKRLLQSLRGFRIRRQEPGTQKPPDLPAPGSPADDNLLQAVNEARDEWRAALDYFDYVTDPELIDHAILTVGAAERKYMYVLKRASSLRTARENTSR